MTPRQWLDAHQISLFHEPKRKHILDLVQEALGRILVPSQTVNKVQVCRYVLDFATMAAVAVDTRQREKYCDKSAGLYGVSAHLIPALSIHHRFSYNIIYTKPHNLKAAICIPLLTIHCSEEMFVSLDNKSCDSYFDLICWLTV